MIVVCGPASLRYFSGLAPHRLTHPLRNRSAVPMACSTRFDVVGPKPVLGRHLRAVTSLHKTRRKRDLFYIRQAVLNQKYRGDNGIGVDLLRRGANRCGNDSIATNICNLVEPRSVGVLHSVPPNFSINSAELSPRACHATACRAQASGVLLRPSRGWTSAPFWRSSLTIASFPPKEAWCREVPPPAARAFTSAPLLMSSSTTSSSLLFAALWSIVLPRYTL